MTEEEKFVVAAHEAVGALVYQEYTNYQLHCLLRRIPFTEQGFQAWMASDRAANPDKYTRAVVEAAVNAVVAEECAAGNWTFDPETGLIGAANKAGGGL